MSIRHYIPKRRYRTGISDAKRNFLIGTLAISMICQILTLIFNGNAKTLTSIITAVSLTIFSLSHAHFSYGFKYSLPYFAITFLFAFVIEALNVATGWPFGHIQFSNKLGAFIGGVPLMVPLAWVMIVHPVLVLARQISKYWIFFIGALGLVAWDIFVDIMMVDMGYWKWGAFTKATPLIPEIPLSNIFGWMLAGMILLAILDKTLPKERRKNGADFKLIVLLFSWIWVSRLFTSLFVIHHYGVALLGGVLLGFLLIPLLFKSLIGDV